MTTKKNDTKDTDTKDADAKAKALAEEDEEVVVAATISATAEEVAQLRQAADFANKRNDAVVEEVRKQVGAALVEAGKALEKLDHIVKVQA